MSSVFICSIYPFEMTAQRQYSSVKGGGLAYFRLPAGSTEQPSILEIKDHVVSNYLGENVGTRWEPIEAMVVARCVVDEWAGKLLGCEDGSGPGIWLSEADIIATASDIPIAEIAAAHFRQQAYCVRLYEAANSSFQEGKLEKISHTHRWAASWLGMEDVPWLRPIIQTKMKNCPLCTKRIPAQAIICPICTTQIAPMPAHLKFDDETPAPDKDSVMATGAAIMPTPAKTKPSPAA